MYIRDIQLYLHVVYWHITGGFVDDGHVKLYEIANTWGTKAY